MLFSFADNISNVARDADKKFSHQKNQITHENK